MTAKHIRKNLHSAFTRWLPLGFTLTMIFGFTYVMFRENLRQGANDPQIQIVSDVAAALGEGVPYDAFATARPIDIARSLSPYVLVFNLDRELVASTATLHGKNITLPQGVFDYAKAHGEDRVTWQPERGVRQATVVRYHTGVNPGYIVSGRSLMEIEKRVDKLFHVAEIAWGAAMLGSLFLSALVA